MTVTTATSMEEPTLPAAQPAAVACSTNTNNRASKVERRDRRATTVLVGELSIDDLAIPAVPPPAPRSKSSHSRMHNSMSALKIADEAFSFGATRLTGPASKFIDVAAIEERRKRLASMKMQHQDKSKSLRNLTASSDSNHSDLDAENNAGEGGGDTTENDRRSSTGSFRGMFRKSSSHGKNLNNKADSSSSLDNTGNDAAADDSKHNKPVSEHKEKAKKYRKKLAPKRTKSCSDAKNMEPGHGSDDIFATDDEEPTKSRKSAPERPCKAQTKKHQRHRSVGNHKREEMADLFMKGDLHADLYSPDHDDDNNNVKQKDEEDIMHKEKQDEKFPPRRSRSGGASEPTKSSKSRDPVKRSPSDKPSQKASRKPTKSSSKSPSRKSSSSKKKKNPSKYMALEDDDDDDDLSVDSFANDDEEECNKKKQEGPPKPPVRSLSPTPPPRGPKPAAGIRSLARTRSTRQNSCSNNNSGPPLRRCLSDKPPQRSSTHRKLLINPPPAPTRRISRNPSWRLRVGADLFADDNDPENNPATAKDDNKDEDVGGTRLKGQRPALLRSRSGDVGTATTPRSKSIGPIRRAGRGRSISSRKLFQEENNPDTKNPGSSSSSSSEEDGAAKQDGAKQDGAKQQRGPALLRSKSGEFGTTKRSMSVDPIRRLPPRTRSGDVGAATTKSSHSRSLFLKDGETDGKDSNKADPDAKSQRPALLRTKSGEVGTTRSSTAPTVRRIPPRTRSGEVGTKKSINVDGNNNSDKDGSGKNTKEDFEPRTKSKRPTLLRSKSGEVGSAARSSTAMVGSFPPRTLSGDVPATKKSINGDGHDNSDKDGSDKNTKEGFEPRTKSKRPTFLRSKSGEVGSAARPSTATVGTSPHKTLSGDAPTTQSSWIHPDCNGEADGKKENPTTLRLKHPALSQTKSGEVGSATRSSTAKVGGRPLRTRSIDVETTQSSQTDPDCSEEADGKENPTTLRFKRPILLRTKSGEVGTTRSSMIAVRRPPQRTQSGEAAGTTGSNHGVSVGGGRRTLLDRRQQSLKELAIPSSSRHASLRNLSCLTVSHQPLAAPPQAA